MATTLVPMSPQVRGHSGGLAFPIPAPVHPQAPHPASAAVPSAARRVAAAAVAIALAALCASSAPSLESAGVRIGHKHVSEG